MNRSEVKSALKKARQHKENLEFELALSILHQVANEYPEDIYLYLLASTYLEAGSDEVAIEYADKILAVNDKYKEAYELKGAVFEKEGKLEEAEKMYLDALRIDYDFYEARKKLVKMYFFTQKRYEDTIEQCEFVLSYKQFDFSTRKKLIESVEWGYFFFPLYSSYTYLKKYEEAIQALLKYKDIYADSEVDDGYNLHMEDELLYKLFYLTSNHEKLEEYKDLWLNHYKVSKDKIKIFEEKAKLGKLI